MILDYRQYIADFCTGDDDLLVDRYFTDDVQFIGGSRELHGKEALRMFLRWAHDGVREVPRVQHYLQSDDLILAEIDMDFHATKPRADFPFGALEPGESITVRFMVSYVLREGKVAELRSMTWPTGKGVTILPRLGGYPTQIAAFHAYCAAFSNADHARYSAFYTDDVVLELNAMPPLRGRDAITGFYGKMFPKVREVLKIHSVLADDKGIALDATSTFTAIVDAPDFVVGPLAKGESMEVRVFVHYELREGRICHIRIGRAGIEGIPRFFGVDGKQRA